MFPVTKPAYIFLNVSPEYLIISFLSFHRILLSCFRHLLVFFLIPHQLINRYYFPFRSSFLFFAGCLGTPVCCGLLCSFFLFLFRVNGRQRLWLLASRRFPSLVARRALTPDIGKNFWSSMCWSSKRGPFLCPPPPRSLSVTAPPLVADGRCVHVFLWCSICWAAFFFFFFLFFFLFFFVFDRIA